jgi:hypothetical protein
MPAVNIIIGMSKGVRCIILPVRKYLIGKGDNAIIQLTHKGGTCTITDMNTINARNGWDNKNKSAALAVIAENAE